MMLPSFVGVPRWVRLMAFMEVRLAPSPGMVEDWTELTWLEASRGGMDSVGPMLFGRRSPIIVGDWSSCRAGLFPPSSLKGRELLPPGGRELPVSEELACWIPFA